jgi:hypothetical protein
MARKTSRERTEDAWELLCQVFIWAWIVIFAVASGVGAAALIGAALGH